MIDLDSLYTKFQDIASDRIGTYLSTIPGTTTPSVLRNRFGQEVPNHPYVTVDIQDVTEESGWLSNTYVNNSDNTVYEVTKNLMIYYRCYGGTTSSDNDKNALWLMNQLHSYFMFDRVREDLRANFGVGVIRTSRIDNTPIQRADTYLESANFFILVNIVDVQEDTTGSYVITDVTFDGELKRSENDPTPLPIDFTVN